MKLNPDLKLLLVFLLLCICQLLRIAGDPVGFFGADSHFYLEAAQNLTKGLGPVATQFPNREIPPNAGDAYLTAFPVGYPLAIAALMWVLGLSAFWASKLVNLLCLGGALLVLRHLNRDKAWLLALVFGTFTLLEVFAYSWSEGPFLFLLLLFAVLLYRFVFGKSTVGIVVVLGLVGSLLFLVKYIGLFVVPLLLLAAAHCWVTGQKSKAWQLIFAAMGIGVVILVYFGLNYQISGMVWGGDRVYSRKEQPGRFLLGFVKALVNELSLVRHYYFRGPVDKLFFVLFPAQLLWMAWFYWRFLRRGLPLRLVKADRTPLFFWAVALVYMGVLIGLRVFSPFHAFYYRLLSPATMLFYLGWLLYLLAPHRLRKAPAMEFHLAVFLLFCLLFQLPKAWLISLIR